VTALTEMKLEPRLVVPVLVDSLNDPRWTVRDSAARGLARIGPAARQAIPALVQSLNDTNSFVHRSITYALKQIDPVAAANAGINTNSLGL
jgi:HEAT repeat protein